MGLEKAKSRHKRRLKERPAQARVAPENEKALLSHPFDKAANAAYHRATETGSLRNIYSDPQMETAT